MAMTTPTHGQRKWSARVAETSDALDLEPGMFNQRSAAAVATSLKRAADRSRRRKTDPYRSAMSMLVFYINRAGHKLSKERRSVLEKAKIELRRLYGRSLADGRRRPARSSDGPPHAPRKPRRKTATASTRARRAS